MITPLELEGKSFGSRPFGFSKHEVREFHRDLLKDYEKIYKENIELKDKINVLNDGISYYKTVENTLQNTLVVAERAAEDHKANALNKAEQIIREAELKAKEIINDARDEKLKIAKESEELLRRYESYRIQVKQIFMTQLEMVERKIVSEGPINSIENKG